MIKSPAPFPHAGSWALHEVAGKLELARIIERHGFTALIGYPTRVGASGNVTVPIAQLRDPTPLTAEEREELAALERSMLGVKRPSRRKLVRQEELGQREIHARELRRLADLHKKRRLPEGVREALELAA